MTNYQDRINSQELKYRCLGSQLLYRLFLPAISGDITSSISISSTPVVFNYDLDLSVTYKGKTTDYAIEIKERNKNEEILKKYPFAELKPSKLKLMRNEAKDKKLIYIVFLNQETAYIFDIDKIDFTKIELYELFNKKVQFNNDSKMENELIYEIPYSMAIKQIDIKYLYSNEG